MRNNPVKYEVLLKQYLRSISKCEKNASLSELLLFYFRVYLYFYSTALETRR